MTSTSAEPCSHAPAADPAAAVEAYVNQYLASRPLPAGLRDAVAYAMFGGGKRMRPVLVWRCCQALGGDPTTALPPAAAIELIHCFSLVHDDLPAMDDDDLRRGRPTLHKHTSEAMAILAGDLMSSLAFELIVQKVPDPQLATALVRELSWATNDMIAGQVYDTLPNWDPKIPDLERLKTIHRHKTGALIRASCRLGALCAKPTDAQLAALTRYGEVIGLMFQVVDDLLDVTQTTEQLGKTAGKDVNLGKLTYPSLLGLDATRQEVKRLQQEAHQALDALASSTKPHNLKPLRDLCDYMATRSK